MSSFFPTHRRIRSSLIITYPNWKITNDHVTTVEAAIVKKTIGYVLNLSATMYSRLSTVKKEELADYYKKPMYVFLKEDGTFKRTNDRRLSNFVRASTGKKRADVPYIDPQTSASLKLSKNYLYDLVLSDINTAFEDYLEIEKEELSIEDYLEPDGIDVDSFMGELASYGY